MDIGDAQHAAQSFVGNLHRPRSRRRARRGLRKRGGHSRMERDVAFDLLHHLMNVAIEYSHGTEALHVAQGLCAVFGAPPPFGIKAPQRDVRKQHDGRAGGSPLYISFEPLELIRTELAQTLLGSHVDEPYEVDALLIEAVPASAFRPFAVALQILLPVIVGGVVLAGYAEQLLLRGALQDLVHRVKFGCLRQMTEVAGMDDELGLDRKSVDLVDGRLERAVDIGIRRFVESDMAVADLNEGQFTFGISQLLPESLRRGNPAGKAPNHSSAGPGHALQKSSTVDPVVVVVMND